MPFRQSASSYIDSTRLLRKLKEKYPDWAKNDSNFQIEFDEDKDITTWCTPSEPGLSKDEILRCQHD